MDKVKEIEYVSHLKELVLSIQTKANRLENKTNMVLEEASKWECPNNDERKKLNELIRRAYELLELEKEIYQKKNKEVDCNDYFLRIRWFNCLKMLIETFEVPLNNISYGGMFLKE